MFFNCFCLNLGLLTNQNLFKMKKIVIIFLVLFMGTMHSQKKNGTIYLEHPAIDVVEEMQQAFYKGDTITLANLIADDFKFFNGMNDNPDSKGGTKDNLIKNSVFWNTNGSYLSITPTKGAYPDALEYKKDNKDDEIWVQTWDQLKGVHNETGVKLDMPIHRLFVVNKDNKIKTMITYDDGTVFQTLREGFSKRTNGVMYNSHESINKVRRMMAAFENKDLEKAYSYFNEEARFSHLEMPRGESETLEEAKARHKSFYDNFEIESIDVVGYPDALEYEIGGGGLTVQSWWNFRLIRKSDKKKITFPAMYSYDFNEDGEITRSLGYFSTKVLDAK